MKGSSLEYIVKWHVYKCLWIYNSNVYWFIVHEIMASCINILLVAVRFYENHKIQKICNGLQTNWTVWLYAAQKNKNVYKSA